MMTTNQVAKKLEEYCKSGKWAKAQKELYAADCWSQEPSGVTPRLSKGIKAIGEKGKFWAKNAKVYSMSVTKPVVAGDWITMKMTLDSQWKGMPRSKSEEICLYNVKEGKIVSEQFFFNSPE